MKARHLFRRHFATVVEYRNYRFPDLNPFDFSSSDYGKSIKMAHYRYPCSETPAKAVILHFHGY